MRGVLRIYRGSNRCSGKYRIGVGYGDRSSGDGLVMKVVGCEVRVLVECPGVLGNNKVRIL